MLICLNKRDSEMFDSEAATKLNLAKYPSATVIALAGIEAKDANKVMDWLASLHAK